MIPAQGGGSLSETVPRGREAGQEEKVTSVTETSRSHGGGRRVALGLVVAMAAGAVWAWRAGVFSPASSSGSGQQGAAAPATQPVTRQDISATMPGTFHSAGDDIPQATVYLLGSASSVHLT